MDNDKGWRRKDMANMAAKLTAAYMESIDMKHEVMGEDGEVISLSFALDNREGLRLVIHFSENGDSIKISAYDLVKFPSDRKDRMYKVCNELNAKYRWVKFYVDERDDTITADTDEIIQMDSCAEHTVQATVQLVQIADEAYPDIQRALWS